MHLSDIVQLGLQEQFRRAEAELKRIQLAQERSFSHAEKNNLAQILQFEKQMRTVSLANLDKLETLKMRKLI